MYSSLTQFKIVDIGILGRTKLFFLRKVGGMQIIFFAIFSFSIVRKNITFDCLN